MGRKKSRDLEQVRPTDDSTMTKRAGLEAELLISGGRSQSLGRPRRATDGDEVFIDVIRVARTDLAVQIRTLAELGRLAAEGTHFVLHLGI